MLQRMMMEPEILFQCFRMCTAPSGVPCVSQRLQSVIRHLTFLAVTAGTQDILSFVTNNLDNCREDFADQLTLSDGMSSTCLFWGTTEDENRLGCHRRGRMWSSALMEPKSPRMSLALDASENNGLSPSLRRRAREGDFRDCRILTSHGGRRQQWKCCIRDAADWTYISPRSRLVFCSLRPANR